MKLTDDPPPRTPPVCTVMARPLTASAFFPGYATVVFESGMRLRAIRMGCFTLSLPSWFSPPSMRRTDRPGSASASLPAMVHPAVPPIPPSDMFASLCFVELTTADDHIHLLQTLCYFVGERHFVKYAPRKMCNNSVDVVVEQRAAFMSSRDRPPPVPEHLTALGLYFWTLLKRTSVFEKSLQFVKRATQAETMPQLPSAARRSA